MPYTLEEIRARHPSLTDAQARKTVDYLNAPAQPIRKIWEGEDQVGDHVTAGPDGLTRPMRELNRFADENALPIPFKARRAKS